MHPPDEISAGNILNTLTLEQAIKLAEKKVKVGASNEAIAIFIDILSKFPNNKKAKFGLASCAAKPPSLAETLQEPLPNRLETILGLLVQNKMNEVLEEAAKLEKDFPNSATLHNIIGIACATLKDYQTAISSFRQAIEIKANFADAYFNMGNALAESGRPSQAIEALKRAILVKPRYAEAHNNLGNLLTDQERLEEAIASYKAAIKSTPNYAEAYHNLGNAWLKVREQDLAIVNLQKASKLRPNSPEIHQSLGNALNANNCYEESIACYERAIALNPNQASAYFNLGNTYVVLGQLEAAIENYKSALTLKPDYGEAHNNMANALRNKGNLPAAIESCRKALEIKPDYLDAYNTLGGVLQDQGELNSAIECYQTALKIEPDYAPAHNHLGVVYQDQGKSDAAVKSYQSAIEIDPNYAEAHRNLSTIYKYSAGDALIQQMQHLVKASNLTDSERCNLHFALAKAYRDTENTKKVFYHLTHGNSLRKKLLNYDFSQDQDLFNQLKSTQSVIAQHTIKHSDKPTQLTPVFILGMPRSGTTLVEQILSSHSQVTGAGESNDIHSLGSEISTDVSAVSNTNILAFRNAYLSTLAKRANSKPLVTDKMPLNFRYIPLICAAFPEAKIVHVKRRASATCWSNYQHYFPTSGLGYCYDLSDVTNYYKLYEDLIQTWEADCAERIYDLDYEKLTTDQEGETRQLLTYLGLGWDEACMNPQNNSRVVKTASQQQVKQKMYQGSSQAWLKYKHFLDGAFDTLE